MMLENRTVPVMWNQNSKLDKRYLSLLIIYSNIPDNKMPDIVQKTSVLNISIDSIKIVSKTNEVVYELGVYLKDLKQLEHLMLELNKQQYIYKLERLMR